ncbi:hypothetical protein [Psychrobacter aquimaris]|uniref:hypothetical protein n=1 Tax=Psychrobacter aquimaris TaxID=292733 RepID=UPI0018DF7106|nr:hypothetical protein [Psychrobacter aquimaris]
MKKPDRQDYVVGWKRLDTDNGYLIWNGDNQADGVEAILVDLNKLATDYTDQENVEVILSAFWYGSVGGGDVTIEFTSYKGGVMNKSGFDFTNSGGALVDRKILGVNTKKEKGADASDDNGEHLATLAFNLNTKSGFLSKTVK